MVSPETRAREHIDSDVPAGSHLRIDLSARAHPAKALIARTACLKALNGRAARPAGLHTEQPAHARDAVLGAARVAGVAKPARVVCAAFPSRRHALPVATVAVRALEV